VATCPADCGRLAPGVPAAVGLPALHPASRSRAAPPPTAGAASRRSARLAAEFV